MIEALPAEPAIPGVGASPAAPMTLTMTRDFLTHVTEHGATRVLIAEYLQIPSFAPACFVDIGNAAGRNRASIIDEDFHVCVSIHKRASRVAIRQSTA